MNNAPKVATSARAMALKLAQLGEPFDAAALSSYAGCSHVTALAVLGKLAAEQLLSRVAHGWYAQPGAFPEHKPKPGGMVAMARGESEAKARHLAEVEAWLTSKEQFPGATAPLPLRRTPNFAPVRRRSA